LGRRERQLQLWQAIEVAVGLEVSFPVPSIRADEDWRCNIAVGQLRLSWLEGLLTYKDLG